METLYGSIGELSQSGFDVSTGRGRSAHTGSKVDQMGHCSFDDCAGVVRIVSGTGAEVTNGEMI